MAAIGLPRSDSLKRQQWRNWFYSIVVVASTALLWFVTLQVMDVIGPTYGLALLLLGLVVLFSITKPAVGLGVMFALAVVGDLLAMTWWPMVTNLSSSQSVLYTADGLTIKPLEIVLVAITGVWLANRWVGRAESPLVLGALFKPLLLFTVTIFIGMVWGVGRGGDFRVAVFEVGPLLYIPLVYLLAVNLFTTLRHYHLAMWGILAALAIESAHGVYRLPAIRELVAEDASPVEHTAALHMNLLFLTLVSSLWFGTKRIGLRLLLVMMSVPTMWLYLDAQRRAAVVGLIIGGLFLAGVLFSRDRAKFKRVVPAMFLIGLLYTGAFWTVETGPGFPAQAIKIILVPDASAEADASSDLYREIENFDLNATIRSSPILGIGFGQRFYQPIPLPDISFFEFWEYIPHNSVLWMWLKVGIVGFLAFLYCIAYGIARGIRGAAAARDPDDARLIATLAAYIPMTFVVAFVDITFDAQTTVLFGLALALMTSLDRFETADAAIEEAAPAGAPEAETQPPARAGRVTR